MAARHSLTEEEDAFLGYVQGMRNSVGKRFIMYHIAEYGFESFENFWEKLKEARYQDPPQLQLSEEERESLASALHASTRRMFLEKGAGALLTVFGFSAGKSGIDDLMDGAKRRSPIPVDDAMNIVLKLSLGAAASIVGIALMVKEDDPTSKTIAEIARGEEGEKNVRQLVSTLDDIFRPVEVAIQETSSRSY